MNHRFTNSPSFFARIAAERDPILSGLQVFVASLSSGIGEGRFGVLFARRPCCPVGQNEGYLG